MWGKCPGGSDAKNCPKRNVQNAVPGSSSFLTNDAITKIINDAEKAIELDEKIKNTKNK